MRLTALATITLSLGTLLSCRQATQITVRLEGEGFACKPGSSQPGYAGTGVLARAQLTGAGDLAGPRADGNDDDCKGSQPVDLGSVVLVPESGIGPVEVLAVAALTPTSGAAPTIDECMASYEEFLIGETNGCAPADPCAACIFARRSLGFVEYSNLDLTISLDNACAGVLCEASKTCVPARGCVSAAVECDGERCEEPAGGSGEGAGGAGGAGGSGGENTGGAPPAVWEELPILGGVPYDVVARSAPGEGGELQLFTYVAAGDRLSTFRDRELVDDVTQADPRAYVAVAADDGGPRVAAVGESGVSVSPTFEPGGNLFNDVLDLDIALGAPADGPSVAVDRGPSAACALGLVSSSYAECGSAVFGVGAGVDAQVLAVAGTSFGSFTEGGSFFGSADELSADWSLWGHAVTSGADGETAHGYGVPSEGFIRRFWVGPKGATINQEVVALASVDPTGALIDAIWGIRETDAVVLYAVGELDSQGWLGRAQVIDGENTFAGWQTLSLPTGIHTLRSVWVGPDPQLDAVVVIVAGSKQNDEPVVAIAPLGDL